MMPRTSRHMIQDQHDHANGTTTAPARPVAVRAGRRRSVTGGPEVVQRVVSTLQLATAPTRMMILLLLGDGEMFAGEIREALHSPSQPAVSHQLSLLRHGRLIEAQRAGRKIAYRLTDTGRLIVEALDSLDR